MCHKIKWTLIPMGISRNWLTILCLVTNHQTFWWQLLTFAVCGRSQWTSRNRISKAVCSHLEISGIPQVCYRTPTLFSLRLFTSKNKVNKGVFLNTHFTLFLHHGSNLTHTLICNRGWNYPVGYEQYESNIIHDLRTL